jgi:hypothetical protein
MLRDHRGQGQGASHDGGGVERPLQNIGSIATISSDCGCIYVLPNCRRETVSFRNTQFAIEDDVTVCQVRVRRMCNFDIKRGMARGMRWDRQYIMCAGAAVVAGLLSVSMANAQSVPDAAPLNYSEAEIFAKVLRDQPAAAEETELSDFSALAYAQSRRSSPAGVQWLAQPMPAVDGFNAKLDGYGGGANHISSLYGANGSLSFPLAQQWGVQLDGGVGSFNSSGDSRAAGHVFWRDPSVGLLGAYGSYSHWNGIGAVNIPRIGTDIGRYAAEGEYYWGRWTVGGLAGYETVRVNAPVVAGLPPFSIANRFFDAISASYYVTDNFKLSIGHVYTIGRNGLALGGECGFALGGGRMAALFARGLIAEGGSNAVLGGLRIYFGQRDKTLIDRHRQDDPGDAFDRFLQGMDEAELNQFIRNTFGGLASSPTPIANLANLGTTPGPTTPVTTTTTPFTSFTTTP